MINLTTARDRWAQASREGHHRSRTVAWVTAIAVVVGVCLNFWRNRTAAIAGGLGLVVFAVVAPETLAIATPILMALATQFGGSKALMGIPALVTAHAIVGVVNGRLRFYPVIHGPVVLLIMWLLISFVFGSKAGLPPEAAGTLVTAVLALGLCGAAAAMLCNRSHLLMALAGAASLGAILVRLSPTLVYSDSATVRVGALYLNPNGLGMLLAWGILASVGLVVVRREPLWLLNALMCASSLPLTKSRGALIVIAVGIAAMVLFRRSRRVKFTAGVVLLAVLLLMPNAKQLVVNSVLQDRVEKLSNQSDTLRKDAGIEGFRAGLSHPVMGLGWGRFPVYAESVPRLGVYIYTHNVYSSVFAETGAPGLLLYLVPLLLALRVPAKDDEAWACKALICAFIVGGLLDTLLIERTLSAPMMLIIGAAVGHDLARRERERTQVDDPKAGGEPSLAFQGGPSDS